MIEKIFSMFLFLLILFIIAQASDYSIRIQFLNNFYVNKMKISQSSNPFEDEILMTCFNKYGKQDFLQGVYR